MGTLSTMAGPTGVQRATGRDRDEWFALLDDWGAAGRPYREIADYLTREHDLSKWWAQKMIVEYEQARGLRPAGARAGGTFTITSSKTVAVPAKRLFEAFVDTKVRRRWLSDASMHKRTAQAPRSARFDWDGGPTRVSITVIAKGRSKSQVGLEHELLPDPKAAEKMKAYWRERLATLKDVLES
jgi:hypothetical protein